MIQQLTIFKHVFPEVSGHTKIIDDYLSNPKASYHQTCKNRKLTFHRDNVEDPGYIVKQCYILLIVGCTELEGEITNLWKKGKSGGCCSYPDFGQYMNGYRFECFVSAAPFAWADKNIGLQIKEIWLGIYSSHA